MTEAKVVKTHYQVFGASLEAAGPWKNGVWLSQHTAPPQFPFPSSLPQSPIKVSQ